jgi:hypothetical protein
MTVLVLWLTDDPCPACGGQLTQWSAHSQVTQECRSCGWAVTWSPDPAGGER